MIGQSEMTIGRRRRSIASGNHKSHPFLFVSSSERLGTSVFSALITRQGALHRCERSGRFGVRQCPKYKALRSCHKRRASSVTSSFNVPHLRHSASSLYHWTFVSLSAKNEAYLFNLVPCGSWNSYLDVASWWAPIQLLHNYLHPD